MLRLHGVNRQVTVKACGAAAGQVLCGCGPNNTGLRLRVSQVQAKGADGPISGTFAILDVGDNKHSEAMQPLLGKSTDAAEVLALIRRRHPGCVSVVNSNLLAPEQPA